MLARPKLVRETRKAAEMAARAIDQGVDPETAQELALENLFLPPEDLQPRLEESVRQAY